MKHILEIAWETLPLWRRARMANGAMWFQLSVQDLSTERQVNKFVFLVSFLRTRAVRVRFLRVRNGIRENLFAVIRVECR